MLNYQRVGPSKDKMLGRRPRFISEILRIRSILSFFDGPKTPPHSLGAHGRRISMLQYICRENTKFIQVPFIWVNYNISLTWIKATKFLQDLGMIPLINHDIQWGRSEVVIIYPDSCNSHHCPAVILSPMIFSSSIKIPSSNHPGKNAEFVPFTKPLNYLELFYRFGGSYTLQYVALEKSPFRSMIFPVFLNLLWVQGFSSQPCVWKISGPRHFDPTALHSATMAGIVAVSATAPPKKIEKCFQDTLW